MTTSTEIESADKAIPLYILSSLVENKPGVLFRITNLFRARNFNIESITVGSTEMPDLSRMTITTKSDERTVESACQTTQKINRCCRSHGP